MRIEVWKGEDALKRLGSSEFREQWERLYAGCPWASVFQSVAHSTAWYGVYSGQVEPLLIGGVDSDGSLVGLFPLAVTAAGDPISVGGRQAEYQVWMSRPEDGAAFIDAALEGLSAICPGRSLVLRYLPPNTPRDWISADRGSGRRCALVPTRRGIMDIDTAAIDAMLGKKGNRRHLRGLERIGPLRLERVSDPSAIDAVLEEIMPLCDLRHGAIHDVLPFRGDPLKLVYHRALARIPGLLHVTVLRCGDALASAQIDIVNRDLITLAIGAFTPTMARHSPGRLHLLFMAREAAREGYRSIDLTPGGGYKDQLATRFDDTHRLHVYPDSRRRFMSRATAVVRQAAKTVVERTGADPASVRSRALGLREAVQSAGPGSVATRTMRVLKERFGSNGPVDLYELAHSSPPRAQLEPPMRIDVLADLAAYETGVSGVEPRRRFLRKSLERLEQGSRAITRVVDGRLVASAWITKAEDLGRAHDVGGEARAGTVVVDDFSPVASAGALEGWDELLPHVLHRVAQLPGVVRTLIAVPHDRADVREAVQRLGGRPAGRIDMRLTVRRASESSNDGSAPSPPKPDRQAAGVSS